jgi:hypothetical protein
MTTLPPNKFDSGVQPSTPDEAVASTNPPAPDATAAITAVRNDVLQTVGTTVSVRGDGIDSKQRLLRAIEDDYHLVFEARKILAVVYAPPSARPENYDKLMIDLDSLTDNEPSPLFLQRIG